MRPMSCGGLRTKGVMTIFQIPFHHSGTGFKGARGSSLATGLVWASVVGTLAFIVVYPIVKLVLQLHCKDRTHFRQLFLRVWQGEISASPVEFASLWRNHDVGCDAARLAAC